MEIKKRNKAKSKFCSLLYNSLRPYKSFETAAFTCYLQLACYGSELFTVCYYRPRWTDHDFVLRTSFCEKINRF